MPTYTDLAGTTEDTLEIGKGDSGDKSIVLNNSDVDKPTIKFDDTFKKFKLNNGSLECNKIELTDNVSLTKGITFADGSRQYSAATGGSSRVPPDEHDILVFKLDESGRSETTFVNTGTLGTSNNLLLARNSGGDSRYIAGDEGIFDNAINIYGISSSGNCMFEAPKTGAEPAYPITVSLWVKQRNFSTKQLFYKSFRAYGTWTAPNASISIWFDVYGAPYAGVTTSGTMKVIDKWEQYKEQSILVPNCWCHVGATYDGTNLKLYVNGNLCSSIAVSGAIDYNSGSGGNWVLGSDGAGGGTPLSKFCDIRVANVARDISWFRQVYTSAMGLPY